MLIQMLIHDKTHAQPATDNNVYTYIWKLRYFFSDTEAIEMKSHKISEPADVHKTCEPQVCLLWFQTVARKTLKGLPPTHHLYQTASYFPITSEYVSQKVSQNLPLCLL